MTAPAAATPGAESRRTRYERLRARMVQDRISHDPVWQDVADYTMPHRVRFLSTDINRGERRDNKIIDGTAVQAALNMRAGMTSGMTPSSRVWKELTTQDDPELAKFGRVKDWLATTDKAMDEVLRISGFYMYTPIVYGDSGVFGIGALLAEEDLTGKVIRFQTLKVGSYWIAKDSLGRAVVFARLLQMTVRQIVERFGRMGPNGQPDWGNISDYVKDLYGKSSYEETVEVAHMIQPNTDYNPARALSREKRFSSCYYETGGRGSSKGNYMNASTADEEKFLSESGYDHFPVLIAPWEISDGDIYSSMCPGRLALGDNRSLQVREKQLARAEEKKLNPAMTGPARLLEEKKSNLPGSFTGADTRDGEKGYRAAHEVQFDMQHSEAKQELTRDRIRKYFYEDKFLMLIQDERAQPRTAYEIGAKKAEQLSILGPVLESQNYSYHDPLIDLAFDYMYRQDRIPPIPRELAGRKLGVRYVSMMAQAQKAQGLSGLERFRMEMTAVTEALGDQGATVRRKVNFDKYIEVTGEIAGVPVGIVRTDEEAAAIAQEEAKAQQQAAQAEQIAQASQAAQRLASSSTDGKNALTDLISAAGQDGK
jgi:hypothetical protein